MSTSKAEKFFSVADVADALGLTTSRIRQRIIAGEIKAERPGGRDLLIPESEMRRLMRILKEHGPSNRGRPKKL